MPYPAVPGFMVAMEGKPGVSALALRFLILTACRTGEVIGAQWPEFDLEQAVWTIPAKRMKAGRGHRVPLSDAHETVEIGPRRPPRPVHSRRSGWGELGHRAGGLAWGSGRWRPAMKTLTRPTIVVPQTVA